MARRASSTSLLRRTNAELVLEILRDGQKWSGSELRQRTGLSQPTVDAVVEDLIGHGLVETNVEETARPGRPPRKLRFRPSAGYVVGVDVQATRVRAVAADLSGRQLAQATQPLTAKMRRQTRLDRIVKAVGQARRSAQLEDRDPLVVAAGTPGAVDPVTGQVGMCGILADWSFFPLQEVLGEILGWPVTIENDTNLAAVGEAWQGAAVGCEHAVVLLVGQRPGAGILTRKEPFHGSKGWAGEMFLWSLWYDHFRTIENVPVADVDAHIDALRQAAVQAGMPVKMARAFRDTGGPVIDLESALVALLAGDPVATKSLQWFLAGGAYVIISLVSLLGPERVIVGGMPGVIAATVVDIWQRALDRYISDNPARIHVSNLGEEAVMLGAVRSALDAAEERLLP